MNLRTLTHSTPPTMLLSYGLGKHSTAATIELIENPASRDFDLDQLILITSMVGDEWRSTKQQVECFLLPVLRAHRVRYVQIARAGPREADGIMVLFDTREPFVAYTEGKYKLSTELLTSGVVPTVCGSRKCSLKFKGWCINRWIDTHLNRTCLRQIIGFHDGERKRVEREERFYTGEFAPVEHPLIRWGWNDVDCIDYLCRRFGVIWKNSACDFCMFSGGKPEVIARYREEPESAIKAIRIERTARTLNPRITLFSRKSIEALLRADDNPAIARADELFEAGGWSLMRVRRIRYSKQVTHRSTRTLARGTRSEMEERLAWEAKRRRVHVTHEGDHPRIFLRRMTDPVVYPSAEEMLTLAPSYVMDKERANFNKRWHAVVEQGNYLHTASVAAQPGQ